MNHKSYHIERRKHPRTNNTLPLEFKTEAFDIVTETINLSCIGVYCQVNKKIPLMTTLKIFLALPRNDEEFEYVECHGVVVRVEDVLSEDDLCNGYNIAIYFNEIEASDKEKITNFVELNRRNIEV